MKKLLMLTIAVFALSTPMALADNHDGKHKEKGDIFAKQDVDGNGIVTRDEFMKMHEERANAMFSKIDEDGNGEISKAESDSAKARWKEKRQQRSDEYKQPKQEAAPESASPSGE